jgi:tetratricopeptide (TPR) repeat protein
LAEAADEQGQLDPHSCLGRPWLLARKRGDFQTAFTIQERMIQLGSVTHQEIRFFRDVLICSRSEVSIELGFYDTARTFLEESLALAREAGDAFRIAHALNSLRRSGSLRTGLLPMHKPYYERARRCCTKLGALRDRASVLQNLGSTCLQLGDVERAYSYFRESMTAHQAQQNVPGKLECLVGFAATAVMAGLPGPGTRLFAATAAISGQPSPPAWKATGLEVERYHDLARASLTDSEFQAQQAAGRRHDPWSKLWTTL